MKKILLIDDDEDDRDFFTAMLGRIDQSIATETRENGLAALQHLNNESRLPDMIFLDLNMPVMNGTQFLTEVKKDDRLKDIPVIVLSTSSDPKAKIETAAIGAADFITKPEKLTLLEARLREIFANPAYNF